MPSKTDTQRYRAPLDEAERCLNEALKLLDAAGADIAAAHTATALESVAIFRREAGLARH